MKIRSSMLSLSLVFVVGPAAGAPQEEVSAKARDEAIVRAMEHLDERLWGLQEMGSPRLQYTAAVTGWAYLLAGDRAKGAKRLPNKKKDVDRIAGYLKRYAEAVARDYDRDDAEREKDARRKKKSSAEEEPGFDSRSQYVWPLGIAGHFFAECAERGKSKKDAKAGMEAIVRVLEGAQQENGGWGHDDAQRPGMGLPEIPIPKPGGGGTMNYPGTLLAASNCALSGLGIVHAQLKSKDDETGSLARGIDYFRQSQSANGTFPYDPDQKHDMKEGLGAAGDIEAARTPGGVFAMLCAGADATDESIQEALASIDGSVEAFSQGHGSASMALQFSALLARARGETTWAAFRREYFPRILAAQHEDGSFDCVCRSGMGVTCDTQPIPGMPPEAAGFQDGAKTYVTAIHLLILLLDRAELESVPEMPGVAAPTTPGSGADRK